MLRGLEKASLEWTLITTSYNLKRLFNLKNASNNKTGGPSWRQFQGTKSATIPLLPSMAATYSC